MTTEKIYLHEGRADVTLTTYILDDSPELLGGKKRPAVLICPGGAYLACSDREGEPVALRFAAMGYHAFVLRYSVYGRNDRTANPFKFEGTPPVNEQSIFPGPMHDIAKAMLTIGERADEWLVDTDRIAICGFSAGSHNCAMYSVYWDKPIMCEPFGAKPEQLKPAAAILGYGLSDYVAMKDVLIGSDEAGKALFKMCNLAFTGHEIPDDEMLRTLSANLHVSKNTPPTYLWATAADSLVPVQQTLTMAQALADNAIPFEVHVFEEGAHGLSLADQSTAMAKAQIDANAAKWVGLAEEWLRKRFGLDLPESAPW